MRRARLRLAVRIGLALVALPSAFVAVRWGAGNFGTVREGLVYRAGQPSPRTIAWAARRLGVRTVLNLRGSNPDQAWYAAEGRATRDSGAVQVDFPMSSDQWLSRAQARTLLEILDRSEQPLLVHCEWGAERTGLVSAIVQLLREGSTLADAYREFTPYYMFLPVQDGKVMRGHVELYAAWLDAHDREHTPALFRRWLAEDYRPGSPSREHWPCNPYPLKVVTRPGGAAERLWDATLCR